MKKITSILLSMLLLFACVNVSAQDSITVELNANKLEFDAPPVNINDRVLVPVRAIAESLDCKVEWYGETQVVEILKKFLAE